MKDVLTVVVGSIYGLCLVLIVLGLTVVPWAIGLSELVDRLFG